MLQHFLTQLATANQQLATVLATITEAQAAYKPSEQQWSVIEILEHCFVVEVGALRVLQQTGTAVDAPNSNISYALVQQILEDRTTKIAAPEMVLPKGRFKSLAEARAAIAAKREEINALLPQINWQDGVTFPHPKLGLLTKADWLFFCLTHTDRHLEQIVAIQYQ